MLTTNQNLQQGRYRIVNQLGHNGAGTSYEAFDNVLGVNVLLKEINDHSGKVMTAAQREARKLNFAEKAKVLTQMKHDSLLAIKDFFSEVENHYLVTELAGESTLGELLDKNGKPFPVDDVANWAEQLLDALNYLHALTPPVVHGEVKPQHVRLAADGKVRLLVFNLVKSEEEINARTANQTFDAAVLPFLPLEQIWSGLDSASRKVILTNYDDKSEKILEQPADERSDVFSLGATLYYLLTARIPADALTRSIDILEGKTDPLQAPSQINQAIPSEISDVVMKALEIKREDRFSSATIMRQVLRTSLVKVKDRQTSVAKAAKMEDDAVLEIPVVQPKPVAPAAPKNHEMESEQARQLELIKQQLREAETRRLEAEKRAAEAEKRLQEAAQQPVTEPARDAEKSAAVPVASSEPKSGSNFENASDDLPDLFSDQAQESGAFKKIAAAAVAIIVFGGGGFGIYTMTRSKSTAAAPAPSVSTTNVALPAPTTENQPVAPTAAAPGATDQTTAQTTAEPTDLAPSEADNAAVNPAAVKPKAVVATPTPQTAQVKKPAPTPAKPAETQKKVTLDDLLKDN
jgi:serine/threonine protein kinase